jgi:hypothetical protein
MHITQNPAFIGKNRPQITAQFLFTQASHYDQIISGYQKLLNVWTGFHPQESAANIKATS